MKVHLPDSTLKDNASGTVLVDVHLANLDNIVFGVPLAYPKINASNGSVVTPEVGDWVLVDFVDGFFGDPIVIGWLAQPGNQIEAQTFAAAPISKRVHAKTSEIIDKDGNLSLVVEGYHTIVTKGDVSIERVGANGKITLKATTVVVTGDLEVSGTVSDGTGTMAAMRGTYNTHTHNETGTTTGGPNEQM